MIKKTTLILFFLSLFFVIFSFIPTIYEYSLKDSIPDERYFVLEHNYNFDYNFYLSRIRQGMEGRWTVTEKYYNQPHKTALFQIVYLYFGKIGAIFNLSASSTYQASRLIFGLVLLLTIAKFGKLFFKGNQLILYFVLAITAGSFPILLRVGNYYRFGTYMGWWSVIDPLSRITIMPHILLGQTFLLLLIINFADLSRNKFGKSAVLGLMGFVAGIIFPPTVIIFYFYLLFFIGFKMLEIFILKINLKERRKKLFGFMREHGVNLVIFFAITVPSLVYLQVAFKQQPWKALSVFDIEHRFIMPYKDYALALGPVLILGTTGLFWAIYKNKSKYFIPVAWIMAIVFLFLIFENVPQQSPLRFTEGLLHVPLAVLATYLLGDLWEKKKLRFFTGFVTSGVVLTGFLVMVSLVLWFSDQAYAKRLGTWPVPLGAQLAYPLKDFMQGVFYLRDNTRRSDVILTYITAGNYIPAYAGNYVYIGHANTPFEDKKELIAAGFFRGEMTDDAALKFIKEERISYVFFGPQERDLGNISDLKLSYSFLQTVFSNQKVTVYKII